MPPTRSNLALIFSLLTSLTACGGADSAAPGSEPICDDPPATSAQVAVDLYVQGLNEPDPEVRPCLFQRALSEDAALLSRQGETEGRPATRVALEADAEVRTENAEVRALIDEPLFRHREVLVRWVIRDEEGRDTEQGQDWIELADDGRISTVHRLGTAPREISVTEELEAWERAWSSREADEQREALGRATTEDVRFSDLLVDVQGRDALFAEIQRQQGLLDGTLDLGDRFEVHLQEGDAARLVRHRATIRSPSGITIEVLNFIRMRDGRIERLAGFPLDSL